MGERLCVRELYLSSLDKTTLEPNGRSQCHYVECTLDGPGKGTTGEVDGNVGGGSEVHHVGILEGRWGVEEEEEEEKKGKRKSWGIRRSGGNKKERNDMDIGKGHAPVGNL
jgi:hypothetical protein